MMIDLQDQADAVTDESTFISFLAALAADREEAVSKEAVSPAKPYESGANGWENATIEAFLGAASAWATDSTKGLPQYEVPSNPWKRCAQILLMGKLYE
jgi:hypothetical protein